MVKIELTPAFGWPNCYRLSNGLIDVIVTSDIGPRIMRVGFVGGPNHFVVDAALQGQMGGGEWRPYGGHRLWHAPEVFPRTYAPDNGPVTAKAHGDALRLTQPTETATGIQKEMDVRLWPDQARVMVTHRLRNHNAWPVELAPWALSVMAAGGVAILPLPPRAPHGPEHLQPAGRLLYWAYTDFADPRWTWGRRAILLRQDPARQEYQKIGLDTPEGWVAYARDGELFIKTYAVTPGARYPDLGASLEAFVSGEILELETLGPLAALAPGGAVEHVEQWHLFREVPQPQTEADVNAHVRPRAEALRGREATA